MAVIYKASDKSSDKEEPVTIQDGKISARKCGHDGKRKIYQSIAREIPSAVGLSIEPRGVRFADKDQDETTLIILRRHPITNTPWLVMSILMFLGSSFASRFGWLDFLSSTLQTTVIYTWLLLALLVAWSGFLSWYFNISIVSDKRVIDIDFHDLIYREVSDAQLDKIEDVTHNMGGLLGIVFNFGDVYIQTAAAKPQIEFLKVPRPAEVANTLRKLREAAKE